MPSPPLCVRSSAHGRGRILSLDYLDAAFGSSNASLSYFYQAPHGDFDKVMYDYAFAILTKAMLWVAKKEAPVKAAISVTAPPTDLKAPVDEKALKYCWENKTPSVVIARKDTAESHIVLAISNQQGKECKLKLDCSIRDIEGSAQLNQTIPLTVPGKGELAHKMPLPFLRRGNYFIDLRVLDASGLVLEFASKSLRVETSERITEIITEKSSYKNGDTAAGRLVFSAPLPENVQLGVKAVDTWQRTVALAVPQISPDRLSASFAFPVNSPLSRLWDVIGSISDGKGVVSSCKTFITIPNWTFDDYMFMLTFAPSPGNNGWKGVLHADRMRKYGVNAVYTHLIYSHTHLYEHNERSHLQSVSFAEHMGEMVTPSDRHGDFSKERTDLDLAEFSRMCRQMAETGKPLSPKDFPHKMEHLTAEFINSRIKPYQESAKFGSAFYVLTGENYLSGDFSGLENSGFGPTTTKRFQEWCKDQYKNDLSALNREWGSDLQSWDQVRGILIGEAVEKDQLPRWVDFRYFMRSFVWSQFFIDWTDMIRKFIPEAKTATGGHAHHDFSRYRDQMNCAKLYVGQERNTEWHEGICPELFQSFSGDKSILMGSQSMIRWTYDLETPLNRKRWPWLVLFMGLNGFDWERGLWAQILGGESCFTPDYSEVLPYFDDISREVRAIQSGIGKLTINGAPCRSKVAMLWSPYNHFISRLMPFQENGFSGTWYYNVSVTGGAPSDCLALMNSIRVRPTIIAPDDLTRGDLEKRGFKALLLPYNKGMSPAEAEAIKKFVSNGGLVIADNEPGIYSQHGRKLDTPCLLELFPDFKKATVVKHGNGHAAYLPNEINGYISRLEKCSYIGSDAVASLLRQYADIVPPVELLNANGLPRRDVFMPVFLNGSTKLVGLLRCVDSKGKESDETTMRFNKKYYVWDVMSKSFCGYTDTLNVRLDLQPALYALMPANPLSMSMRMRNPVVKPGETAVAVGRTEFTSDGKESGDIGQVAHIKVTSPDNCELEFFTQNILFKGQDFTVTLPVSYSAKPGRYFVQAENPVVGMRAETVFDVPSGSQQ